ncbi:MAG: GumC family protein [Paracoccus sp. (in: a-proteobacteria)]
MIQSDGPFWRRDGVTRDPEAVPEVDLATTIRTARAGLARQWRLIAGVTLVLTVLALTYVLLATPKYTARAELVVDPRISNSLSGPESPTLLLSDALVVDSELKVLSSREVTTLASEELGLFAAAEEAEAPGPIARAKAALDDWLGREAEPPAPTGAVNAEATRREIIRRTLMQDFDISRDGGTYVIDISHTSEDPVFAMEAVNTLIDAYFRVSSDAALSDTRRISNWLDQRVAVLAGAVQAADVAVTEYRRENDLFTMRDDVLPSEAELSDATDRLIRLRSELIEIATKTDKIKGIAASDSVAALMDGTLGGDVASPALRDFQTRYAGLVSEERDLAARFGAGSDSVARSRQDQDQLRDLMLEEAAQIAERLDTQQEATRREIAATEAQVEELRARANADAEKSIRLRELERDADAKRSQYVTMAQEMISASQRETFQRAPARVIARAVPPDQVSSPNARRLLILTVFGGLVLGSGLAFLREVMDTRLRRAGDLQGGLGLRYLGFVPGVPPLNGRLRGFAGPLNPPARGSGAASSALRNLIAELQRRRTEGAALVTGVTSIRPGEGRAVLAGWLARGLSDRGGRVALVDLDPRPRGGATSLPGRIVLEAPAGGSGLDADLARLRAGWQEGTPLVLGLAEGADLLDGTQQQMLTELLATLRHDLDQVLVILPPLDQRAEAETAAMLIDGAILALRWGETALAPAEAAVTANGALRPKLIGAVFTAARSAGFRRYNG